MTDAPLEATVPDASSGRRFQINRASRAERPPSARTLPSLEAPPCSPTMA